MSCSATLLRLVLVLSLRGFLEVVTSRRLASKRSRDFEFGCRQDGEFHPVHSIFLTRDCQWKCHCLNGVGDQFCSSLCPKTQECENGTSPKEEKVPVRGTSGKRKCYCLIRHCPKGGCRVDNKHYEVNETFTRRSCSEHCRCGEDGSLMCAPVCPMITCPRGQRPRYKGVVRILGGCSCPSQECVPPPYCKIPADYLEHGKFFITSDCQTKCRCKRNNTMRCEPLCSTSSPVCSQDEELFVKVKFYAKKKCSCTRKRCVKKDVSATEHDVGELKALGQTQERTKKQPYVKGNGKRRIT